jgi:hypothetical protein
LAGQTPQQLGRVVAAYLSADLVVPMIRPVNVASLIPEALAKFLPAEPECDNGMPARFRLV